MENLEKSWNYKIVISRPVRVLEKKGNPKSFAKVMEMCLHSFIYVVYIYIYIYI